MNDGIPSQATAYQQQPLPNWGGGGKHDRSCNCPLRKKEILDFSPRQVWDRDSAWMPKHCFSRLASWRADDLNNTCRQGVGQMGETLIADSVRDKLSR